jgi:hypothetical protein
MIGRNSSSITPATACIIFLARATRRLVVASHFAFVAAVAREKSLFLDTYIGLALVKSDMADQGIAFHYLVKNTT